MGRSLFRLRASPVDPWVPMGYDPRESQAVTSPPDDPLGAPVAPTPSTAPPAPSTEAAPHRPPAPSPAAPKPPTGRPPRPRRAASKSSVIGWIVLAGSMGFGLGTCATCGGGLPSGSMFVGADYSVGVVELLGPIMETKAVVKQINEFAAQSSLDAIVVRIDSPGGAVAPSQEVFAAMRRASEKKPVVASMGSVAASGGFWAAMGADYVFASAGTITGSIGVISQAPDLQEIAKLFKFRMRTFKSGPLKDAGNPLRAMTKEDEAVFMDLVQDIYDQFVQVVRDRRKLDLEAVQALADGRVLTGRAAKEAGLIDELGGLHDAAKKAAALAEARAAQKEHREPKPIEEPPALIYPRPTPPSLLKLLTEDLAQSFARGAVEGLEEAARAAPKRVELR